MHEPQTEDKWHLFNDFLVRPVKKDEALTFNTTWKLPSVMAFQIKTASNRIDDSWKKNLDTSLLYKDSKYACPNISKR
jgi:PAB-dependent poly(A)-specific ribonuclease subunit 2